MVMLTKIKDLFKKSFEFKVDNKSFESVLTNYLCFNLDKADDRKTVLECLLNRASNIPTSTVESYVLKCSIDGDKRVMYSIPDSKYHISGTVSHVI